MEVRYVSMSDLAAVERAIDANTCAVYLESVTNPQLEVADCKQLSSVSKKMGVPLIMDNTMMTPYLFNSGMAGVNVEVLSSTKYISGGATSVGGVIIDNGNFDWKKSFRLSERAEKIGKMAFIASLRQEIYRNVGACMSPHNAYLQSLGLETMSLRIEKSCENTQRLAEFLVRHEKIRTVHYPGLPSSPYYSIAADLFDGKCGGLLTFDLETQEACYRFIDSLELVRRATNINDNKTLILHPFSTIFAEYSEEQKMTMGVRPTMLRLSVGIEDYDDLYEDMNRGLDAL
jgi:O-acetylhomoserine (thiol)-lyase